MDATNTPLRQPNSTLSIFNINHNLSFVTYPPILYPHLPGRTVYFVMDLFWLCFPSISIPSSDFDLNEFSYHLMSFVYLHSRKTLRTLGICKVFSLLQHLVDTAACGDVIRLVSTSVLKCFFYKIFLKEN